jgi:hypothetical protein
MIKNSTVLEQRSGKLAVNKIGKISEMKFGVVIVTVSPDLIETS